MPKCHFIKTNGELCESPALQHNTLCYFHHTQTKQAQRRATARRKAYYYTPPVVEFGVLEDPAAIQVALMRVMNAVVDGTLNEAHSGRLLWALQIAASNVQHARFKVYEQDRRAHTVAADEEDSAAVDASPTTTPASPQPPPADPAVVAPGDAPSRSSDRGMKSPVTLAEVDGMIAKASAGDWRTGQKLLRDFGLTPPATKRNRATDA